MIHPGAKLNIGQLFRVVFVSKSNRTSRVLTNRIIWSSVQAPLESTRAGVSIWNLFLGQIFGGLKFVSLNVGESHDKKVAAKCKARMNTFSCESDKCG